MRWMLNMTHFHSGELLLACVVAWLQPFATRKDGENFGVGVAGHPGRDKTRYKDDRCRQEALKEIEDGDSGHRDHKEKTAFDPEYRQGPVQALEDSIAALCISVGHGFLCAFPPRLRTAMK